MLYVAGLRPLETLGAENNTVPPICVILLLLLNVQDVSYKE